MDKWFNFKFLFFVYNKFNGFIFSWLFVYFVIRKFDFSGNRFIGFIFYGNFNVSKNFNNLVIVSMDNEDYLVLVDGMEI